MAGRASRTAAGACVCADARIATHAAHAAAYAADAAEAAGRRTGYAGARIFVIWTVRAAHTAAARPSVATSEKPCPRVLACARQADVVRIDEHCGRRSRTRSRQGMGRIYDTRRYLTTFDTHRVPSIFTDLLILGSGVAGLRAAIEAEDVNTIVVTKDKLAESNTAYAQGGIAVSLSGVEDEAVHIEDTLRVACGLADRAAARKHLEEDLRIDGKTKALTPEQRREIAEIVKRLPSKPEP